MPPPDAPRIVDTVAESEEDENVGVVVDDLRRASKPSSSRPRNEIGPLGVEDIRSEPPANSVGSDRPRVLNVIEINASETPRNDPFGEEITTESPVSRLFGDDDDDEPSVSEADRELAREYALDDLVPAESDVRVSLLPVRQALARREELEFDEQTHSLSSVLGARPSLRPSPQPDKPRDSASVLWWLVVAALVAIIAAAGAIAAREQFANDVEPEPPAPEIETASAPVLDAPKPRPVSFGTPQTVEAKVEPAKVEPAKVEPAKVAPAVAKTAVNTAPRTPASPSPPSVVPAAQSSAVRVGAPYTSAVTGAASAANPNPTTANASPVKPTERKAKPVAAKPTEPANNYAPGYGKAVDTYAPGYNVPASKPAAGKPDLTPAAEARDNELPGLPINPYE